MAGDWARPVVHWEIVARDAERQAAFYRELFHWEIGAGPIMQRTKQFCFFCLGAHLGSCLKWPVVCRPRR